MGRTWNMRISARIIIIIPAWVKGISIMVVTPVMHLWQRHLIWYCINSMRISMHWYQSWSIKMIISNKTHRLVNILVILRIITIMAQHFVMLCMIKANQLTILTRITNSSTPIIDPPQSTEIPSRSDTTTALLKQNQREKLAKIAIKTVGFIIITAQEHLWLLKHHPLEEVKQTINSTAAAIQITTRVLPRWIRRCSNQARNLKEIGLQCVKQRVTRS